MVRCIILKAVSYKNQLDCKARAWHPSCPIHCRSAHAVWIASSSKYTSRKPCILLIRTEHTHWLARARGVLLWDSCTGCPKGQVLTADGHCGRMHVVDGTPSGDESITGHKLFSSRFDWFYEGSAGKMMLNPGVLWETALCESYDFMIQVEINTSTEFLIINTNIRKHWSWSCKLQKD